ncbi:MlaD family protein [Candidatus Nitrotoga arctica]|uniref:Paraquat-inducible protein B n=1 Tax=Candidatus Nitrotoga arctica TaxID=453162 RepID=A0ABM8YWK4_9PROT|nr:MlaD family protein [Candidatus Nitrotoga arctica]CAG9931862.1 Paraquat-inducible protein B [Candidatus Nitrotoga arctica]
MKRNALLIGSFVLAALFIAIGALFWLSGSELFSKQQKASVYFDGNVSGLSVGAPVTFRGVTVGQVADIGILMDTASLKTTVPVTLNLQYSGLRLIGAPDQPLELPYLVQRGLRARLASQSIVTGQKAVELDFLPDSPATLHGLSDNPEIPVVGDRFDALIDQVADLPLRDTVGDVRLAVQELRTTLLTVQRTLDSSQAILVAASEEVRAVGTESRKTLMAATQAIQQVQVSADTTLRSITSLTQTTQQTVLAAQPELQATLMNARQAAETAKVAMTRIADIAAPGAPLRSDLESTVRDLSQAARSLRSLSELLEEKPNAIVFGNTRK